MPRRLGYSSAWPEPPAATGERWPAHLPGQPCPVIGLLHGVFGAEQGSWLLYEFTCFPMDDATAYEQAEVLCLMQRAGVLGPWLRLEQACLELSLYDHTGGEA